MLNKMQKGAFMLFLASTLMAGFTSCDDNDPDYDHVVPPTVEVAPNTLTGVVTAKSGNPIQGAIVTFDKSSVSTDANGIFYFTDLKAGKHTIKVEAKGMISVTSELEVKDLKVTQNLVWNTTLAAEVKQEVVISKDEETKGSVVTEALEGNDKAEVTVETTVPVEAVEAAPEAKIVIEPIYDQKGTTSRASYSSLLVGTKVSCTDPNAKLIKPLDLTYNVDKSMTGIAKAMKRKGGNWVPAESKVEGDKVVVTVTEFTEYGLFFDLILVQEYKKSMEILNEKFDNLYGKKDLYVGNLNYKYTTGIDLDVKSPNVLTALIIEKVAQIFGAKTQEVAGLYPLNVRLPVGTMLTAVGKQDLYTITATVHRTSVSATKYGDVKVTVNTTNRQHSGGTN